MRRIPVVVGILVLVLGACGGDTSNDPDTTTAAADVPATVSTTSPPPTLSTTSSATASIPRAAAPASECREGSLRHRDEAIGRVEECHLTSGGLRRSYQRYVPAGVDPDRPTALLISLHAATQDPQTQMAWFPFDVIADREGFIVVAPAAVDGFWNHAVTNEQGCDLMRVSHECGMIDPFTDEVVEAPDPDCRPDESEQPDVAPPDDLMFLEDIIESLSVEYTIDEDRVFLAGASWGGWMASRAACAPSHRFAAIAAMTNTIWYVPGCETDASVAVIGMGGTDDVYHPACMSETYSALWAEQNGCVASPEREEIAEGVTRVTYSDCIDDASIVFYAVTGLWTYPDMAVPEGFDALEIIWQFLQAHPRQ